MAKRSQRRRSRQERDQAGCIWGLISIFDFRHGRSTKRLLADRRRVSKQGVVAGHSNTETILAGSTEKCEDVVNGEEIRMPMADVAKPSVKELMEEEMFNEQGTTNQPNDSEITLEQINSKYENHMKKNQKRRNRSRIKSSDMDVSELNAAECLMPENFSQVPEQKPLDNLDLKTVMEELAQINHQNTNSLKHDFHGDLDLPSGQAVAVVEEKLVAAVKLIIEQRLSDSKRFGEEPNSCCSKEFTDALQTLSLNKGLFMKLLQDPNSVLVKHIQNLEDTQLEKGQTPTSLPGSNLSEEKPVNLKSDEFSSRKHRSFFRRRSKSLEGLPLGGDKDCPSPNKIVILRPGPAGAQSPETDIALQARYMDNNMHNDRNASQFSFTEIKRRLRHAMGKDRQGISPDRLMLKLSPKHQNGNNGEKGAIGENFDWSSPNRNHFYTERFTIASPAFKKGEPVGKIKDKGSVVVNETCQCPRHGGSNIYIEAKKHLSEMLKSGDENAESMSRQLPKSLGRILSLPEYNASPCCSPRKNGDDIFITAQMRLSPRVVVKNNASGLLQENHNNHPSPRRQNLESQPCISNSNSEDKVESLNKNVNIPLRGDQEYSLEIQSSTQDTIIHEVQSSSSIVEEIKEMTESGLQEEEKTINISSESSIDSLCGDIHKGGTREVDNEESASQLLKEPSPCFKSDTFGECQILSSPTMSPSHSPVSREVEDSDCAIDKIERPSPISILEPVFTDDDISPASAVSQPVEKEIQPRHIHFEEQLSASDPGICTRISLEDEESAFEYVEAVLLGSGLNWDEFLLRWLSLYEILDSSLFDEVELFSSRPRHDQKLLFDCANEALKEVCESYFRCFTGISHAKPNTRPVPKGMDLINEIWKRVEWHLFQHPQPHSLDQLVKRDLAISGKWMNLLSDIEHIGFEMGETIFSELVEDAVLSFVDDTSECEFTALQTESEAIEGAKW